MLSRNLVTALIMCFLLKCSLCHLHQALQYSPTPQLQPCKCHKECPICEAIVICAGIQTQAILDDVIERSSHWIIDVFDLNGVNVQSIPTTLFKIPQLCTLEVAHSSLVSLFDHIPPKDNELDSLSLDHVRIADGLQWPQLAPLMLVNLTLRWVSIPPLDDSFTLFIPQSMIVLTIDNCLTSELSDHAFASMEKLQILTFSNNNLRILKRSMFPDPAMLTKISFKSNKIEVLPYDLFTDMPYLREIVFADNVISTLSEETFLPVINHLTVIDFSDNPLYCGCNMRWVAEDNHKMNMVGTCVAPKEVESIQLCHLTSHNFGECNILMQPVVQISEPRQEAIPEVTAPPKEIIRVITAPPKEIIRVITAPPKETIRVVTSPPEKVYITETEAPEPSGLFHAKIPFFELGF